MQLEKWRGEIDSIDAEIINLLNRRADTARKIGVLKATAGLPIVDLEREDEILRKVVRGSGGVWEDETIIQIYRRILQKSRKIQMETAAETKTEGKSAR